MMSHLDDHELQERLAHYDSDQCTPEEALALFDEARGRCPVAYSHERGGYYLLMGYHDVKAAHSNWQQFSTEPSIMRPVSQKPPLPPLEYHPPVHTAWRKLFTEAFNNKTPDRIEADVRADIAARIEKFAHLGACELIADYIRPIPLNALCMAIGIDPNSDKAEEFHNLANGFLATFTKPDEFPAALGAIMQFGINEVMSRREHPADDYLTWLANAEIDGKPIGPEEIGPVMASMLVAGHETSVNGLAGVFFEVLRRPEIRDQLVADPNLIRAAVDEGMRIHTPFFGFYRRALEDTEISGIKVAAGTDLLLCWAAANRDPDVYPDPAVFRLDRQPGRNRHLSFGFGIHACPGQAAAQMEMRVAVAELLRRLPDIELTEPDNVRFEFTGGESCAIKELHAKFTPPTD
jgi:cytochrome P450